MGVNRVAPIITGQSTAQTIKGSLRFDSGSSHYLSRNPGSAGNRRTWTWSGWVKRGDLAASGVYPALIHCRVASNTDDTSITFTETDQIRFVTGTSNAIVTNAVYRDYSAWYHLVVAFDTTQSVSTDRIKLYVNGIQETSFASTSYPSQNSQWSINTTSQHRIGRYTSDVHQFSGSLANVFLIDGQALGPGFFGFTDPLTGTWRPKRLKDGAPTASDGRTFSGATLTDGGSLGNLFDGNSGTSATQDTLGTTAKVTNFGPVQVVNQVSFYSPDGAAIYTLNGGKEHTFLTAGWHEIEFSGSLTEFTWKGNGARIFIYAMAVDGIELIDATTTNVNFGTNGFYLPLDDQDDYTTDKSGKGNNWTANNFSGDFSNPDVVSDSPSGVVGSTKPTSGITTTSSITKPSNYATLNPLQINNMNGTPGVTLSNGNLKLANNSNGNFGTSLSTLSMTSGKWYCEGTVAGNDNSTLVAGLLKIDPLESRWNTDDEQPGYFQYGYGYYSLDGNKYNNLSNSAYGDSFTVGDTIGIAFDADAGTITFYNEGVSQGVAYSSIPSGEYCFGFACSETGNEWEVNFGQKPFKFQPPDGYLTLCSANLRPSTVITHPDQYVGVTTYIGNGSTQSIITGFKPDFVWIKRRNTSSDHQLYDTVRGDNNGLSTNLVDDEWNYGNGLTSFDSDGFSLGSLGGANGLNDTHVAWTWKAGGGTGITTSFWKDDVDYGSASAAGLTGGTITPTGASIGTKQGFSIIRYTGTGSSGTISHGLGKTPSFIIVKNRSFASGTNWQTYHKDVGNTSSTILNGTAASNSDVGWWNNTSPTSSVFSIGSYNSSTGNDFIAYLWTEIPGFSKFGTYTGNGSDGGPFLDCGFRPRWFMTRGYAGAFTTSWFIWDTATDSNPYNESSKILYADLTNPLNTHASLGIDILSNGIKLKADAHGYGNYNGLSYIYAAFAEAPAFNLYGGQSLAR